jgi:peptidyl-prolyl cis-trans isomerase A (cyclophilin A)
MPLHPTTRTTQVGLLFNLILLAFLKVCDATSARISFVNFSSEVVNLYWQDTHEENRMADVGSVLPYESEHMESFVGHKFVFEANGLTGTVLVEENKQIFAIGPSEFLVQCSTTEGDINAHIIPEWSPYGAARFLNLVDIGYFDGCALNRVVPKFLTQFGIGADYAMRTKWRMKKIPDDPPVDAAFQPGYLSYAGSGDDSRSTEVFVVMPGTRENQLESFGSNSWETPFGFVEEDDLTVVAKWYSYGDIPPWGEGPDPQKIFHEDGYEYLEEHFPEMSYIHDCKIISAISEEEEEEL